MPCCAGCRTWFVLSQNQCGNASWPPAAKPLTVVPPTQKRETYVWEDNFRHHKAKPVGPKWCHYQKAIRQEFHKDWDTLFPICLACCFFCLAHSKYQIGVLGHLRYRRSPHSGPQGIPSVVLAFGASKTGKSFSLLGPTDSEGLIARKRALSDFRICRCLTLLGRPDLFALFAVLAFSLQAAAYNAFCMNCIVHN